MNLEPLAILAGLVAEYSPTAREADAVSYLVRVMRALGMTATRDPAGNAVGSLGDGPNEILMLGHIDTVRGFITVEGREDALFGRGAVDAKGPLACFTAAAARAGARLGWKLTVIGAVGEEGTSPGAQYLRDHYPAPAMLIIGEPSGWDHVTLGYKGSLWLRYSLSRDTAHTAARTASACDEAVGFWNRLQAHAATLNEGKRVFEQLSPSLRAMHSASDGFSDSAELAINLRTPPGLECGALAATLAELAMPGQIQVDDCTQAYRGEKNTPLVRAFLAAIRQAGGQPGFTLKTGTSDMNVVAPRWNCPVVAYGPGDSDLDHTPNEHIQVEEYLKGVDVLASALRLMMA